MPELSEHQHIALMQSMVETSASNAQRSAGNCYANSERNLSTLIHTAVMLMILGLAVDRNLWLSQLPPLHGHLIADTFTSWNGAALIGLGMLMALVGGLRFVPFVIVYHKNQQLSLGFGMFLPTLFALFVSGIGAVLLIAIFFPM
jgi:hypothetical protein